VKRLEALRVGCRSTEWTFILQWTSWPCKPGRCRTAATAACAAGWQSRWV